MTPALSPWTSFYAMIGSGAAALTGLVFIVITLINNVERPQRSSDGIATFSTPTVVHFSAVFLISATLCAPWHSLLGAGALLFVGALGCIAYVARIGYLATRIASRYQPDAEDRTWYAIIPLLAYIVTAGGAAAIALGRTSGLIALAAAVGILIIAGIHNAWDTVTYIAVTQPPKQDSDGAEGPKAQS